MVSIVALKRTPFGKFLGMYSNISAVELGSIVISSLIRESNLDIKHLSGIIMGQALPAGNGQNPARQAAIKAGVDHEVPSYNINSVCGSGLHSIIIAFQQITYDKENIIIAAAQENMTQSVHYLPLRNKKIKAGNVDLQDAMLCDGLIDAYSKNHMGVLAEKLVHMYNIDRVQQDEYSFNSHNKLLAYMQSDSYLEYVESVDIKDDVLFKDELRIKTTSIPELSVLKPAFKTGGAVTAGNSSSIADGSAGLLLMGEEKAKELNMQIIATIKSVSCIGVEPDLMGIGPVKAIKKALSDAEWNIEEVEVFDINEAFAAQVIAVLKELEIDYDKVNIYGGAIALGHPLSVSGIRCLMNVVQIMNEKDLHKGVAAVCVGGGMGIAVCLER